MELMEGLTLLSTDTTKNDSIFLIVVLCVMCTILFILGIIMTVYTIKAFQCSEGALGVFGIFFTAIAFVVSIFGFNVAFTPAETTYKVVIDESVSMIEFNERYEILDQDGLIYEIVEKGK